MKELVQQLDAMYTELDRQETAKKFHWTHWPVFSVENGVLQVQHWRVLHKAGVLQPVGDDERAREQAEFHRNEHELIEQAETSPRRTAIGDNEIVYVVDESDFLSGVVLIRKNQPAHVFDGPEWYAMMLGDMAGEFDLE